MTVLDRLIEDLRARGRLVEGQERPAVILWTDPKEEWRSLIELAQSRLEELLVLGDLRPEARTGPAIWIRCLVDGSLDAPALPEQRVPIVYLPGVARQQLRAGEDCPGALKPLVELMFRGTLWLQPNGSDWNVLTWLASPRAVGLDVGRDQSTGEALVRALPEVALMPVAQLTGRRLQADDFDRILAADVVRDLLRWMGDPAGTRTRLEVKGWPPFRNRCREELGFDPETEADVVAGRRLGQGEGVWAKVWERYAEAPTSYGDIVGLLRRSRLADELPFSRERWPDLNDEDEAAVRQALGGVKALPHQKARETILVLEKEHGPRRNWVWARLGSSPMALVLDPLARLAGATRLALGGKTPDDVATAYLERGWQGDAAAWEALAMASTADEPLVADVVRHLLAPWLDDSARALQASMERSASPGLDRLPVNASEDTCILFADGLRFDLGVRLAGRLEARGCRAAMEHRWAALPTVTATAKPAVTPVADDVVGEALPDDFTPRLAGSGKAALAPNLRSLLRDRGYQVLERGAVAPPLSHPARGWVEVGEIDALGHQRGIRLARSLHEELDRLAECIQGLLDAGWKKVRVVTDHGWLLLPGGLPKVDLPKHLAETRWARCAVITGHSTPEVMRTPWRWNASQWFATAPGIACFNQSPEYAHGGLSIQECLVPDITIERCGLERSSAAIASITWRGLRCFVEATVRGAGVTADLRLERPSGPSVTAAIKTVEPDGSVSLVLAGDDHEADSLVLVLLDPDGLILAHKQTRVGADS